MLSTDKNSNPFQNSGDTTYVSKLQKIDTSMNKMIDEVIDAQKDNENTDLGNLKAAIIARVQYALENLVIGDGVVCTWNEELGKLVITLEG